MLKRNSLSETFSDSVNDQARVMKQVEKFAVVIGKESTGKSQLVASLTGRPAYVSNFRGATVSCEFYEGPTCTFVDTPGILRQSDTVTTRWQEVSEG